MRLYNFVIPVFLVSVSFFGSAQSKTPSLTRFGKEVKKLMPEDTYNKTFSVNYKSEDEFKEAIKGGTKNYYKILGLKYDNSTEEKVEKENEKVGLSHIDSDLLFHAQTYAISKAFREMKILKSDNLDDLAQKYVDEFNKAAKSVKDDDIASTFTAMTTAVANFLKSEKVTSEKSVKTCIKYFMEELKKYEEKD